MSERYIGSFISSTAPVPTLSSAPGKWTLIEAMRYIKAGTWPQNGVVNYMIVAGGGGGAAGYNTSGGGGGGGGVLVGYSLFTSGQSGAVVIGAGGVTGDGTNGYVSQNGSNSSVAGMGTSIGGGRGSSAVNATGNGGSGGGSSQGGTVGLGTSGQGNNGGLGASYAGGGGGGAGAVGGNSGSGLGGVGGIGFTTTISGTSQTYGAGGSGAGPGSSGRPSNPPSVYGAGGQGSYQDVLDGAPGQNGVVIISYPTGTMTATGGTITTSGGNTIHKFTSSGTFQRTA